MTRDWKSRLQEALEPLPTRDGGIAIILATAGEPPALAMLSSGDVLVENHHVHAVVYGGSSVVARLGGSFSLLVPVGTVAVRVETVEATATAVGEVSLLVGRLHDLRPTAEPPWIPSIRFHPSNAGAAGVVRHLDYWAGIRDWLRGKRDSPPATPA